MPAVSTSAPDAPRDATLDLFRQDVLAGLSQPQKTLPCKYFYDSVGSALFDRITRLDAYYPTRTERQILEAHGDEMAALVGPGARIVEYGSGSSDRPAAYVPIDISNGHLLAAADRIRQRYPGLHVAPVHADYTAPFTLPDTPGARTVVFFPGSTIGNFEPDEARQFLARMARVAGPGGGLLIGVDLEKDEAVLERAYDDEEGVTAQFNFNLLTRINRELGGGFDLNRFRHRACWNADLGRVEMHLVSADDQTVTVDGMAVPFRVGEHIHTENSYKYTPERFAALAAQAGFDAVRVWTDSRQWFSVQYLTVVD